MKKTAKALLLVLCALILVVGSVFGTLAYLTSQDEVTNTFTVGKVKITMDEANVTEFGEVDGASRVKENTYRIMPAHNYVKDPVVRVEANSENSYLFIKVTNNIAAIEVAGDATAKTIDGQILAAGWTQLSTDGNTTIYSRLVEKKAEQQNIPTFTEFKVSAEVTQTPDGAQPTDNALYIEQYDANTIVVTAYAVQADGFDTAAEAWNTTFGAPVNP